MNTHSDIGNELSNILFWDPICLSFISAISHTKKEDYRCYHTAQSSPTPWNS